ncbi:39S ribosomal protein L37 [Echinococcus granulosus]|uniref:39S ribosomal protein L37 n=1 Tax=Echinococcus granulosus TaxID=6210 RepID=U6JKL4_ECHGR|nr:39S ribosomal protein L37 [Echinococcus granulosus]EUB61521.1 39S ribosomal protein L37 [Echinococcus granulosus]CDS22999.1 39S ribosomal protein L37 mitochondrial [Echinococcus granulosus]
MRLTFQLYRRIRHDFLPVYIKKQWKEQGSIMTARRLRVPRQALADPRIAEVAAQAEDTFVSTRYRDALAREIEMGATPEERAVWERQLAQRLAQFGGRTETASNLPPCLIFEPSRLFCRDIAQVAMLTNTVVHEGAPSAVQSIYEEVASSAAANMQSLVSAVERSVLHAHVWHTDEDKLPKRYNPELLIWKFKTEFGIHPTNVARYLLCNLFRVCQNQSLEMHLTPSSDSRTGLPPRWLLRDRVLETSFLWGEEQQRRVQFSQRNDLVLLSPTPTPLFEQPAASLSATEAQIVEASKARMHLISPLIDLTSTTQYRQDSSDGIRTTKYLYPHLITVNIALPNTWSDFTAPEKERITVPQRQAIGLMHCYASCIATAKRLYGNECGQAPLPEPIAVEAVCTDGVFFDFIAFQLNTLATPDWSKNPTPQGPMNVAWVDGNHEMVRKRFPKRSMLRNTRYTDLDMKVFYRLFACYLYGTHANKGEKSEAIGVNSGGVL